MLISNKATVQDFLAKWQRACSNGLSIVPRDKNRDLLSKLGWTFERAKSELRNLSVQNYVKGPEPDRDKPGEFWFFCRNSSHGEIYIKVKIFKFTDRDHAKCVSFHLAEYPMKCPYK